MTQKDLQAAIRRAKRNPRRKVPRYSAVVREAVAAFVRGELAGGGSMVAVAETLGLPINTVRRWSATAGSPSRLAPVEVVTDVAPAHPVLVTPCGHRVEGLSVAALAVLFERLG